MTVKNASGNTVVTIGNFDGVHLGHAALIDATKKIADKKGQPLTVLTFDPHPRIFFKPNDQSFCITSAALKEKHLKRIGVDEVYTMPFDTNIAAMTPNQFIEDILVQKLNASHVLVGTDFHFGKGRAGHVDTLQADGRFDVTALDLVSDDLTAISSTRIRQALKDGNIDGANVMLGWEWEIEGTVQHGDKRGRELGYPTANIDLGDVICPAYGVYAVRVQLPDSGDWYPGVANIGIRPMFRSEKPLLEVFIFDLDGDLYGQSLRVRPIQHLRVEEKFDTIGALKAQMAKDVALAKEVLAK